MKKLAFSLLACLACFQSSSAIEVLENPLFFTQSVTATSPLSESLLEMETILEAIGSNQFPNIISPTEFAVSLFRKTQKINVTGKVKYILETCVVNKQNNCKKVKKYQITIRVTPNTGIGPNTITVLSIEPIGKNHNSLLGEIGEENQEDEVNILN